MARGYFGWKVIDGPNSIIHIPLYLRSRHTDRREGRNTVVDVLQRNVYALLPLMSLMVLTDSLLGCVPNRCSLIHWVVKFLTGVLKICKSFAKMRQKLEGNRDILKLRAMANQMEIKHFIFRFQICSFSQKSLIKQGHH